MHTVKGIYSLNTHPISNNRWNMGDKFTETIYMTALSILYGCRVFDQIEFYVDARGYEYLSELPCKVTQVNFDEDQEIWMKSKIYAIKDQTEPFIHIDTDIFLRKPNQFEFDQVLVERKDNGYHNYRDLISFFDTYCQGFEFWNPTINYAWSCGVLGFTDLQLRDDFVTAFEVLENILITNQDAYLKFKKNCHNGGGYLEPSLLLEQYNLTSLLTERHIEPRVIIQGESHYEQSKYANEIGYVHLLGASKYHTKNVDKIKELLQKEFYDEYTKIQYKLDESQHKLVRLKL
ncbi:DUF6734 family protein [Aquimarina pacifica]|uniref:DUF6734 family protein n=1 Tax=Aquimarina pacifica TaxID=1296415 RepID=UPI000472696B|nr:DUF6734 family protein [Aquimarina pacifica]